MQSRAFERSAGYTALLVGIVGFLYSVSFVLISRSNAAYGNALAATFLLAGGVLGIVGSQRHHHDSALALAP